ncbi:MAG: hypothetical protein LC643_09195 [Bacteroidales bacterium]|nr:hypothetical protein [Bacteroidales bacterium]
MSNMKFCNMKHGHLWMVFLVIQYLSIAEAIGQEQGSDTTLVKDISLDYPDWQLPNDPSLIKLKGPLIRNRAETLYGTSNFTMPSSFQYKPEQIYLNTFKRDSAALVMPKYPGLGDYQNFGGTIGRLRFTDKLAVDYGAFISVQYGFLRSSRQIVSGSNYMLRYELTNTLQFQSWGQFVSPGKSKDPTFKMPYFFPKTHFGAGLLFDSNEKTQINMGVEYQYDQLNKMWVPESGGKVRIKF